MALNQLDGRALADEMLEFRRADDIGKEEREQHDAVPALEFLDARALLRCLLDDHAEGRVYRVLERGANLLTNVERAESRQHSSATASDRRSQTTATIRLGWK
jgi:hypothetical protein